MKGVFIKDVVINVPNLADRSSMRKTEKWFGFNEVETTGDID